MKICIFCLVSFLLISTQLTFAGTATLTLAWDANNEEDLLGYRVYWGQASGNYRWSADVGKETRYEITGLSEGVTYYIAVTAVDYWGNESKFSDQVRAVAGQPPALPTQYRLSSSYPNPFNQGTFVQFALPEPARVTLHIYNALGQKVRTLYSGTFDPGLHLAYWDGLDDSGTRVPAGTYFCILKTPTETLKRSLTLVK